ncbi:MAG TPA: hypothetical protein VIG51_10010 [Candidatus Baltobacteraceae bacterium]|jgi:hypothetical protein
MAGKLVGAPGLEQPTQFKTITHVHSSPFCTTLRENIGPAIGALIQNNIAIGNGRALFLKMARDRYLSGAPGMALDMDMVPLDRLVGGMVKNLAATDAALDDSQRFPAQPGTQQERRLIEMRKELEAIADRQRQALNILSGTYYGYTSNELLQRGNDVTSAVDPHAKQPKEAPFLALVDIPPSKNISASTAATPAPLATIVPTIDIGLIGLTQYTALFNGLTTYQIREEPLESQATRTILESAAECKNSS